jgi:ABC-type branched-subunit amino acid transport system ATPase component
MTTDTPLLATDGLVAGYTDVNILHGVTVQIGAGEMVSIIGPNGAGKSTLIKTLSGLLPLRQGSITFEGVDITGDRPHRIVRRGIAYVPQLENVFPTLTIEENLEVGASSLSVVAMRRNLERVYDLFPLLRQRRRQRAGNLSGGQRQMLALGRAMMVDPKLLMLDEPSAGLAPAVVDDIFELIQGINREGHSILLVEQNARRALAMSDRGYVLDLGKNRFEGPGPELLNHPKVVDLYLGGGARLETEEGEAITGEAEPVGE